MEVKSIINSLNKLLLGYKTNLQNYSDEQFNYKQSDGVWSLGQMYEHLVVSANYFFLKNIKYCIEQRNGQIGGEKNANGENVFKYNSFPPIKVKVPGDGPDPIAQNKANYEELFEKIIHQLDTQAAVIEADNGDYKTMHPIFGWHNAQEWLASFEMHHRHHLRQKADLERYLTENSIV